MKPVYQNNGTYGCVLRPAITCDTTPRLDDTKVSKLFKKESAASEEKQTHMRVVEKIDPKSVFTLKLSGQCHSMKDTFDAREIDRCKNFDDSEKQRSSHPQLVYDFGGMDLAKAARQINFEVLFAAMWRVFRGLSILEQKGYTHLDIKPENIVYNPSNDKMALIDFGLTRKSNSIYSSRNYWFLGHQYAYYPIEFQMYVNWPNSYHGIEINDDAIASHVLKNGQALYQAFPHEWKNLALDTPDVVAYANSFTKNMVKGKENKIDVYMLGISILDLLCMCCKHGTVNLRNKPFISGVMKLIKSMTHFDMTQRTTPKQAYDMYEELRKHVKNTPIVVSPQVSPVKIVRKDVKPKECPPGKVVNPKTGRCIKIKEVKPKECPPGKEINPKTGRCIKIKVVKPKECPPGKEINPKTGRCVNIKVVKPKECPPGKEINPKTGRCIKIKIAK